MLPPLAADPLCPAAPAWAQPLPVECVLRAVDLVRKRAINALAQGLLTQHEFTTTARAIDALRQQVVVYQRMGDTYVYSGSNAGQPYTGCAAGVTWSPDQIEVSLREDWRRLPLVLWEGGNSRQWLAGLTFPDGSGGGGDGPVVQMLADARGVSCESLVASSSAPLPLVTR